MVYLLFIISIALSGIVLIQFAYLAFLSANNEQLRKQLNENSGFKAKKTHKAQQEQTSASVDESWPEFVESESRH